MNPRTALFESIPYFWADLNEEEYALYDCFELTQAQVDTIRQATKEVDAIFNKTAKLLRTLPDSSLLSLGYPKSSLPYLKAKRIPQETVIARYDWVLTPGGPKLLELNADTPTFIKETFDVNGRLTHAFNLNDPNAGQADVLRLEMRKAIVASAQTLGLNRAPKIVFTSHDDHLEDRWTTRYLQEVCALPSEYVPLHQLLLNEDGLWTPSGEKIDILYRQTYPIEHLVEDRSTSGDDIGLALLELETKGLIALINPLSAFLLQSKAVQALIVELAEHGGFFTDAEHATINRYFLPTYLEAEPFLGTDDFVKKPAFGREGDSVTIFHSDGTPRLKETLQTYADETAVYQAFVELPTRATRTENGIRTLHYMFGCFCLNGTPSALGVRAGALITNNQSYFLAIGTND